MRRLHQTDKILHFLTIIFISLFVISVVVIPLAARLLASDSSSSENDFQLPLWVKLALGFIVGAFVLVEIWFVILNIRSKDSDPRLKRRKKPFT